MMAGAIPMICYMKLLGISNLREILMVVFMAIISILGIFGAFLSVLDVDS